MVSQVSGNPCLSLLCFHVLHGLRLYVVWPGQARMRARTGRTSQNWAADKELTLSWYSKEPYYGNFTQVPSQQT